MHAPNVRRTVSILSILCLTLASTNAAASTIAQNVSWTIDRPDSETTLRVVAYGDSIFAGYKGSIFRVAIWAAPNVSGEYASALWGTDVEVVRRTKSGATASDIYQSKIVEDASWMQAAETRVVAFEMCGNDALQARSHLTGQEGVCDYSRLDQALHECTTYQEQAMVFINANAHPGVVLKQISNLYYPGYDSDDSPTHCTDATSGQPLNKQDIFLSYLAHMNWRACNLARLNGFKCADTFAEFMGSDYDSNDDGRIDSRALRFRKKESEESYVHRITTTLRPTLRDADSHFFRAATSFDYIQSDDTHPTYTGGTVYLGALGGSANGSSPPRYSADQIRHGKNRIWKKLGHERMGHTMSKKTPALLN